VIGAGSLVCQDVPAYSICGGNPVKVIGWRYDFDVIKEMVKLDWKKVKPAVLCHVMNKEIDKDNVKEIIYDLTGE
jgi:acyl-[acyl carrier protein]--UDP-N-acetylglucosamine O-acyltransferase